MPVTATPVSPVSAARPAPVAGMPRAMWRQVCLRVRIELSPAVATALREMVQPSGAPTRAGDHALARRVLEAAGIDPSQMWRATGDVPVRLEQSPLGAQHVSLVVDAVASDLTYISTWKPQSTPLPGTSQVLARSGYCGGRSEAGAPLLEACTRFAERLTAACQEAAASPFEFRIMAWPMGGARDRHPVPVERYMAGGPNAAEFARTMAQQRQAQIAEARAAVPPKFVPLAQRTEAAAAGAVFPAQEDAEEALAAGARMAA